MNTKQIRQTILDLAIRGELVPQDPTDEPASVLLERIRAEKEQLIKDKKLKRDKKDNEPIDEVPFELPEGWEWCRLGNIGEIIGGGTPSTSIEEYWNGEISWITPADLSNHSDKYIAQGKRNITQLGLENSSATLIPKGGILFSTRAPIGYVVIADKPLSTNQGFKSLYPFIDISKEFIYYFLLAEKEKIKLFASGTTFQELSASAFSKILIPLPPLAEQHRIAQKVEQLLAIVDTIEQLQEELKDLVKQTKNQVLNYAIAGKLTYQDPNDEPAEALLKRIGKTTTTAADTPYEKLPKGWAWCRLGDIGEIIGGGTPSTSIEEYWNGEISWITPADLSNYSDKHIAQGKRNITQLGLDNSSAKLIPKGSILFSTRAPIGYVVIADRPLSTNQGFKSLSLSVNMSEEFVYYFLLAEKERIKLLASGTTFQELSASAFSKILIPLPPLAEQHRIVKKIETYFSLLEAIEIQINS